MKRQIIPANPQDPNALPQLNDIMHQAGQAANLHAARVVFEVHAARRADNTIRLSTDELARNQIPG